MDITNDEKKVLISDKARNLSMMCLDDGSLDVQGGDNIRASLTRMQELAKDLP